MNTNLPFRSSSSFLRSLPLSNRSLTEIQTIQEIDESAEPVKRSGEIDDGVFEFGDLHECGGYPEQKTDLASQSAALRRSHSTGDIDDKSSSSNEIPYIDSGRKLISFFHHF